MNVLNINGASKQRCNFTDSEANDAAAYAGDQEGQLGVLLGESDEFVNVRLDGIRPALHGRDGIALALQPHTLTHNGTEFLESDTCCTATVSALQVAAEDKDFVLAETSDVVRRDTMAEFVHATEIAVFTV